ncbi:MAG: hypothetical protein ACFE8U_13395 [Candidatus Hermodarchaeota archaeon]
MSFNITELSKNKYFLVALILYISYLILLFFLAIPYIPEMFTVNGNEVQMNLNPTLIFVGAAIIPAILMYLILEFKHLMAPFLAMNRRILVYITLFLLLQFGINIFLAICLVVIKPNLLDLSTYDVTDIFLVWIISCSFCSFSVLLNTYIGWRWIIANLEKPSPLHWLVGYVIYFLSVGLGIISIQIINPSVKNILLWPFAGIGIIGALNLFLVSFIIFITGLTILGSSMASSESDAFVGFVFMMGIPFMIAVLYLPFFYALPYYLGIKLASRKGTRKHYVQWAQNQDHS